MIVDTSAMMALVDDEVGAALIAAALAAEEALFPAPALVEFRRVVSRTPRIDARKSELILADLLARKLVVVPFNMAHVEAATIANAAYGIGNKLGGTLNLLDLMVYACAKVEGRPILCTGRDFAATDAAIHPASRLAA